MPLIFPPAPVNGDTYTDDNSVVWQFDGVKWNVVTGTTKRLFNGVILGLSLPWNLTNTSAAVDWSVETTDTGDYWSALVPSKIYAPGTGYYNLNLTVFTDSSGAGYYVSVLKNGLTTVTSGSLNPNQSGNYNDTVFLNQGEYIEVVAYETQDVGNLTTGSTIELVLIGYSVGTGVTPYSAFSGVKTTLSLVYSTTSTPTAISWDTTAFDTNANALALTYWSALDPTKVTIKTPGFYQVSAYIITGAVGGTYTLTLRKNGATTIATTTIAPNDRATINQIYDLDENDYIELLASDTTSSGNITTETYLEVIRMGV